MWMKRDRGLWGVIFYHLFKWWRSRSSPTRGWEGYLEPCHTCYTYHTVMEFQLSVFGFFYDGGNETRGESRIKYTGEREYFVLYGVSSMFDAVGFGLVPFLVLAVCCLVVWCLIHVFFCFVSAFEKRASAAFGVHHRHLGQSILSHHAPYVHPTRPHPTPAAMYLSQKVHAHTRPIPFACSQARRSSTQLNPNIQNAYLLDMF